MTASNEKEKAMMRAVHVVLAAALAAVPASCDDPGGDGGEGQQPPPATEAPPSGGTGDGTQTNQPPPVDPDGVLGSLTITSGGYDLTLDITDLKRQGQSATLSFRITNTDGEDAEYGWEMYGELGTDTNDTTVSGVTLVDPVNAKKYLVARSGEDEDSPCACSPTNAVYLYIGDSAAFYAAYAAPPPDVTTVNVEFPTFGTVTDVPIS